VKGKLKSGNEPNEEVDSAVLRCPHTYNLQKNKHGRMIAVGTAEEKREGKKKGILNSLL